MSVYERESELERERERAEERERKRAGERERERENTGERERARERESERAREQERERCIERKTESERRKKEPPTLEVHCPSIVVGNRVYGCAIMGFRVSCRGSRFLRGQELHGYLQKPPHSRTLH